VDRLFAHAQSGTYLFPGPAQLPSVLDLELLEAIDQPPKRGYRP
jgi:hypothetical protein